MKPSEAREIRKQTGLSPEEWALRLAVHFTSVYRWERGQRGITPMVAQHLRRTLREFLTERQPVSA